MSFETDVKRLQTEQTDADPVTVMKRLLAPVKAEAQQNIADFRLLVTELGPSLTAARTQQAQAGFVGVRSPSLDDVIRQVVEIVNLGENGFKQVITMCDVGSWEASQRDFAPRMPGKLRGYQSVFGTLRSLVLRLPALLGELERLVADAAARPARPARPAPLPPSGQTGPRDGVELVQAAEAQRATVGGPSLA